MRKIIVLIIAIFTLVHCGTTGKLELPEGVEDKSEYTYPPVSYTHLTLPTNREV